MAIRYIMDPGLASVGLTACFITVLLLTYMKKIKNTISNIPHICRSSWGFCNDLSASFKVSCLFFFLMHSFFISLRKMELGKVKFYAQVMYTGTKSAVGPKSAVWVVYIVHENNCCVF